MRIGTQTRPDQTGGGHHGSSHEHPNPTTAPSGTGPVLAVISLALVTVVSAVSGLNAALPDLARETGASQTELPLPSLLRDRRRHSRR